MDTAATKVNSYDAFISYSHAADGQLTPAVQHGMQSIGRPWNRRRALRVFRDKSSLSATPQLWPTIEEAMLSSRYFVLLASPQAAGSPWVNQEIEWWRSKRSASTVLIGLTDGELVWDHARRCFDPLRTTALPPAAVAWFTHEPLWVDLRWARQERHLTLSDPRFRDCMAALAAPVRGVPKDDLIGEDIREHRRRMRLAKGGVTLLATLMTIAVATAVFAYGQWNTALARQIASAAVNSTEQHLDLSMLLAVEGYREKVTPQSTTALFQAATASPHLVHFADNGAPVTALASTTDGAQVVTGGEDGAVRIWDAGTGRLSSMAKFEAQVTTVAVSDDVKSVAVGGADGLVAVVDRNSTTPVVLQQSGAPVLALAVRGDRVAVVDDTPSITLFSIAARRVADKSTSGVASQFANPSVLAFGATDDELLLGTFRGETSRWSTTPLRAVSEWTFAQTPAGNFTSAYSSNQQWFGYYKFGVWVGRTGSDADTRTYPLESRSFASAMAIAPDASRVAVASQGTISVVQAEIPYQKYGDPGQEGGLVTDPLTGIGAAVTHLTFVGGNERLVSASQRTLALWDLRQQSRIALAAGDDLPDEVEASTRPGLAISTQDGTRAWVGDDGLLTVEQPATATSPARKRTATGADGSSEIFFSADGRRLYTAGSFALGEWTLDEETLRQTASWKYPSEYGASFVNPTSDASILYATEYDGTVHRVSTQDGGSTQVASGDKKYSVDVVALKPDGREMLVVDFRGDIQILDLQTGLKRPGPALGVKAVSAAYSSDGRYLAVSDGQASVVVWDTLNARVTQRIAAERVAHVRFNPRADRLATITEDGRIALWEMSDGSRLGDFKVRQFQYLNARDVGYQTELAWEPSGEALWTATTGGTVVRWDLAPSEWIAGACAAAGRSLTAQEWEQIIGGSAPGDLSCTG